MLPSYVLRFHVSRFTHSSRRSQPKARHASRITHHVTMQPSRILPDLQCSLLCEEIRQEVTGSFILIGVLNFIRVPQVPVVALKLSLFNRWTAGVGQFTESVRLV